MTRLVVVALPMSCVCSVNINMQHKLIQLKLCSLAFSKSKYVTYTMQAPNFTLTVSPIFVRQQKVYSRCRECTCHQFVSSLSANRRCTLLTTDSHTTSLSCIRNFISIDTLRRAEYTPGVPLLPGQHRRCTPQHTGEYPKGRYGCEPVESTWWQGWQVCVL